MHRPILQNLKNKNKHCKIKHVCTVKSGSETKYQQLVQLIGNTQTHECNFHCPMLVFIDCVYFQACRMTFDDNHKIELFLAHVPSSRVFIVLNIGELMLAFL